MARHVVAHPIDFGLWISGGDVDFEETGLSQAVIGLVKKWARGCIERSKVKKIFVQLLEEQQGNTKGHG